MKNIGGMQRVSMQLVRELERKEGVNIKTELMHASWNAIGFKTAGFLLEELFRLPRIAEDFDADVILFSSMVTASLSRFIRSRVDIPMVTINHGQDVTLPVGLYQWFVPRIFASLDGVISVSRATRQACIERGMAPEKGVSLPNGFDLSRLNRFPGKETARAKLQEQFGMPLGSHQMILTVGRQVKRKGHEWFIRRVLPHVMEKTLFVAVGDGEEYQAIKRAAEESPAGDRIYLLGRQPDEILNHCYAAADLFVMPNIPVEGDMEGFGIVMLEANMGRTPAVASDLEGIKDVITDGENGFLVPVYEPDSFAEKINAVLENGLDEFSERTRDFVKKRFSWEHVADEYVQYLKGIVGTYNAGTSVD